MNEVFGEAHMGYVQPESDSDSEEDPFASDSESESLSAGSFSELSDTEI